MKLYSLILSLFLTGYLFGQNSNAQISEINTVLGHYNIFDGKAKTSTLNEEVEIVWDINDSLAFIPSYDTYCAWNNVRVHPYKKDLTNMRDTLMIPLVYADSCDYHPPFIGRVTSDFGERRYRYHYGTDIKLAVGDKVHAVFEGVVRISHYSSDYGNVVVLRHKNGLETLYAHLSKRKVRVGDWVDSGDIIGLGGNTGRSTGSHLHFETRYLGEPINPSDIIDWETGALKSPTLMLSQANFAYLKEIRAKKYLKIRPGDTLSGLARKYGTTVSKLCKLNGIRSTTTLRVGRSLRYN